MFGKLGRLRIALSRFRVLLRGRLGRAVGCRGLGKCCGCGVGRIGIQAGGELMEHLTVSLGGILPFHPVETYLGLNLQCLEFQVPLMGC